MEQPSKGDKYDDIRSPLSSLQLPQMPLPENLKDTIHAAESGRSGQSIPSICVLVVADLDLASASALAEYALQQKRYNVFDASLIDLCIACGPFCRDDDLDIYRTGTFNKSSSKSTTRRRAPAPYQQMKQDLKNATDDAEKAQHPPYDWSQTPFFRSDEENAALEGNMTATLSQLESIVCRLLFCPGSSDPLTTFSPWATNQSLLKLNRQQYDCLTPNSRNMNHLWYPLAPGLGCGGLFYLDSIHYILSRPSTSFPSDRKVSSSNNHYAYGDGGDDDDDDDLSEITDEQTSVRFAETLPDQVAKLGQTGDTYYSTLSRLLHLPTHNASKTPALSTQIPWKAAQPQSILVTHYVDSLAITSCNDSSPDGSNPTMPWPAGSTNDRNDFFDANRELMCLEIASGSSRSVPAQWIQSPLPKDKPNWKANVLLPGSLRERGEFSLVHLGVVETSDNRTPNETLFEWKVMDIKIHCIGEFPDE
ncbi:hypothetical protein FisN_4Lh159 [Fistulifera solaris]|uniref:Uncharacterized protein n=1 Tax=Fistulifera solaris TaxID=1519565 RepID=A0A1Z5JZ03_FISSO|nr:hypothetical protein FisN_4Lh159 [Fistulifera solaris]|eukprot:GAX19255.1 hypothetical protein FisN_4Lh159 [Fistulifera solaris]